MNGNPPTPIEPPVSPELPELRPIPGYGGRYLAGTDGNVYSVWTLVNPTGVPRLRKASYATINRRKWLRLILYSPLGRRVTATLHRLIAAAWLPPRPSRNHIVWFKNGNNLDTRPENLRWISRRAKAKLDGLDERMKTSQNKNLKHTADDIREIRRLAGSVSRRELARRFSYTESAISAILVRRTWAHVE